MRTVVVERFGGPEVLEFRELEKPTPGAHEVLLRVRASGVCGQDLLARAGAVRGFRRPLILGHEVAGTIEAVGAAVAGFEVGMRVATRQARSCHVCDTCRTGRDMLCAKSLEYGQQIPGGYAEYMVADPASLALVPDSVDWPAASIAACTIGTIINALRVGQVGPGARVLVTGAGGGLGVHALQVAKAAGAEAVAVTSSAAKRRDLEAYCDHVIVSDEGKFQAQVRRSNLQPDIIIELTAGLTLDESVRAVVRGGKIALIGNVDPNPVPILPGAWVERKLHVFGIAGSNLRDLQDAMRLVELKLVKPVLAGSIPLADAARAHRHVETRQHLGRYVLIP